MFLAQDSILEREFLERRRDILEPKRHTLEFIMAKGNREGRLLRVELASVSGGTRRQIKYTEVFSATQLVKNFRYFGSGYASPSVFPSKIRKSITPSLLSFRVRFLWYYPEGRIVGRYRGFNNIIF